MIFRICLLAGAALLCWPQQGRAIPAFNGAEGFGAETSHARGTTVCRVTLLTDDYKMKKSYLETPGEFRYCLLKAKESFGAYIVFDVSGTITLKRPARIPPHVYIAGQTSPGGIAFEGNAIALKKPMMLLFVTSGTEKRPAKATPSPSKILVTSYLIMSPLAFSKMAPLIS